MPVQINLIQNQVNFQKTGKSCLATKKLKIPSKWSELFLWFIFFFIVNRNFANFAHGYPLNNNLQIKRLVFPKLNPTAFIKTAKSVPDQTEPTASESFEIKFPGGGIINAKGVLSMGLISATAALLFICDHFAKVVLCIVRRLNNTDGNAVEIQMEDQR